MAKHTTRDQIWQTAIDLAVNGVEDRWAPPDNRYTSYDYDVGVIKNDLLKRVDAGDRTVHDVLKTMVDMGLLGEEQRQVYRRYENKNGYEKWRRVTLTVYYAAGDLADDPVETSDLMGSEPYSSDTDSEDVEALREEVGLL
jgi:hypothetical protein